jgi:hypothetical protein
MVEWVGIQRGSYWNKRLWVMSKTRQWRDARIVAKKTVIRYERLKCYDCTTLIDSRLPLLFI